MMKILLLLVIAVSACYSLPSGGRPIKTGVQQLVTAFEQLQSSGRSFILATDNGLNANKLAHLKWSASEANTKVTKAVLALKGILGVGEIVASVSNPLDILFKDVDDESFSGVTKLALLSLDPLVVDDVRLKTYVSLFKKRLNVLDTALKGLRGLLDKTDKDITAALPGLIKDLTDEGTVLSIIFNAADSSFQDAVFASRLLVIEHEGDDQANGSKSRERRALRLGGNWGWNAGLSWSNGRGLSVGGNVGWNSRSGWGGGVSLGWSF